MCVTPRWWGPEHRQYHQADRSLCNEWCPCGEAWQLWRKEQAHTHTHPQEEKNTWKQTHGLTWRHMASDPYVMPIFGLVSKNRLWLYFDVLFCFFRTHNKKASFKAAHCLNRNPVGQLRRLLTIKQCVTTKQVKLKTINTEMVWDR